MKFPYGISDFGKIVSENYYYRDRSGHIPLIEDAGPYLLFIRPRRFGKSLLLSMLANYFFKQLVRTGEYPQEMLDENLAADEAKLQYVSELGNLRLKRFAVVALGFERLWWRAV